jgi:NADPH2:quinone reductase
MTQQMQAIEIIPPGQLVIGQRPVPIAKSGEILIRVAAAGVNRPDLLQRMGKYPPPPGITDIPGLEVAGVDVATGNRVCALLAGGGYAEYAVAPLGQCLPIPDHISMIEAAALPETVYTVWNNVFVRGKLQRGETILIHGGSSGIGTIAIQMAKTLGARVIITAGSDEKCAACVALGADLAINYKTHDFVTEIAKEGGVDIILDMVGGDYVPRNLDCLKLDGRHVSIASLNGAKANIDIRTLMQKRIIMTGSTLRARSLEEKEILTRGIEETIWPHIARGTIKPLVHATFPLAQAQKAHELLESGNMAGKIVLTTDFHA